MMLLLMLLLLRLGATMVVVLVVAPAGTRAFRTTFYRAERQQVVNLWRTKSVSGSEATLSEVFEDWAQDDKDRSDVISRLFPKDILKQRLDVAFKDGKSTGAFESFLEGQNFSAHDRFYASSFVDSCREWSEVGFKRPGRKHKLEAYVELLGSPSDYGKVFGRTQTINDEMAIFCARPAELAWINVRIMHKVFHEVVQAFMAGDPESDDYRLAYKLRVTMADSFKNEASRRDEITRLLNRDLFSPLGFSIGVCSVPGMEYTTDGSSPEYGISVEFKNEKGVGGGDPYMQNLGYYVHFTARTPEDLEKHCCPWLLIEVVGPEMGVSGAAWAYGAPCAQPLTPNVPFLPVPADKDTLLLQARLCMALRIGCAGLKNFYGGREFAPLKNDQSLFPYPRRAKIGGAEMEFEYTECLGGRVARRMVFLAKRSDNGGPIVVKFTDSYSEDVHKALADAGLAPTLHDIQDVSGLRMVVMDFVDTARMWNNEEHQSKPALTDELERVLEVLERNNFVHGDLRAPNVLVDDDNSKISIVDFDWAGTVGEVTYRKIPNPELSWLRGSELGAPITVEHDQHMIRTVLLALPTKE
jgi:RIO1 family